MADRRMGTLRHYYRGCHRHRKIDFCEPHPIDLIRILFNIIQNIGRITLSLIWGLYCTGSISYNDSLTNVHGVWFRFMGLIPARPRVRARACWACLFYCLFGA